MEAFVAVARHSGFSPAARHLGVATSVLTKRVDQLEWRTKVKLFERSTRSVQLTELGAAWLPRVESALESVGDVLDGLTASKGALHGPIRLKVPTTLTLFYLSSVLFEFQSQHPGIALDLVLNDRFVNPVEEEFDMVLAAIPGTFPGAVERSLCQSRRFLCASPDYLAQHGAPRQPSDLGRHPILLFGPMGTCLTFQPARKSRAPLSVDVEPKLTANDGQVVLAAALAGKGVAVLAQYTVTPSLLEGKLVRVLDDYELQTHWLRALVPASKAELPRIRKLIDHLRAHLNPTPPWDKT